MTPWTIKNFCYQQENTLESLQQCLAKKKRHHLEGKKFGLNWLLPAANDEKTLSQNLKGRLRYYFTTECYVTTRCRVLY